MKYKYIKILIIVLITIVLSFFLVNYFQNKTSDKETAEVIQVEAEPQPTVEFGLVVDSLSHDVKKVKKNQYLADILISYDVDYRDIDQLVKISKKKFDVRKIKQGNKYHVYYQKDSIRTHVKYFVYEINKTEYVAYQFLEDSIKCLLGCKKIVRKNRWLTGTIESSLWLSIQAQSHNPILALDLSEIYAWTVDFFGLQKGDKYILNYDELYVDDASIGIGDIHYAILEHKDTPFYAFLFTNDTIQGKPEYFNEEGESLRKAFLKAPLRYSRISSKFSHRRYHPVLKIYRPHHGVDYAAPKGTPVHTIGDGVVIKMGYQRRGAGRYVKIKHNSVYTTTYMHLSGYKKGLKTGKRVNQGDIIGYVGSTGLATGPHLDFRVYKNGSAINPLALKSPSVKPVATYLMPEFGKLVDENKPVLDSLLKNIVD